MMNRIGRERGWPPSGQREYEALRAPNGRSRWARRSRSQRRSLRAELFTHDRYIAQMSVGAVAHKDVLASMELFGRLESSQMNKTDSLPPRRHRRKQKESEKRAKREVETVMRIDVHAHYWTDDYLDQLVELGKTDTAVQRGTGAGGGVELDTRLRLMERAGIEMQVLSASPQLPYGEDPDKTMKLARFVYDEYAELLYEHRVPLPGLRRTSAAAH